MLSKTGKRKYVKKDKRVYWYKFFEEECVLCGRGSVIKERQYSEKPDEYEKRHGRNEYVCGDHFI